MMAAGNWNGQERRAANGDLAALAEDAACRASRKVLGDFTEHDLSTKDGRAELRADFRHLRLERAGTEEFRKAARAAAVKAAIGGGVAGIGYAIWQVLAPHMKGGG